jgi:hypothetical protein
VIGLRRAIITAFTCCLAMLVPAAAHAAKITESAGGVTATLSYTGGPGITTKDERLTIKQGGSVAYDQKVPATGCFKVCGPYGKDPVHVADLYGNGGQDVVLTVFTGGADCCTLADVYVPSAATSSYVFDQHNFGEGGVLLKDIGPGGRPEFVSADPSFYCRFTGCYGSGLPLQILEFSGERFLNVTKHYPKLITADASKWLKIYDRNPAQGQGALAAWAGDEDNLGDQATVRTVLQLQIADGHLKQSFVRSLQSFLKSHGYS